MLHKMMYYLVCMIVLEIIEGSTENQYSYATWKTIPDLSGKRTNHSVLAYTEADTIVRCARHCLDNPYCASFFFVKTTNICQLCSKIVLDSSLFYDELGSIYYKFNSGRGCGAPPVVPLAVINDGETVIGTVRQYKCIPGPIVMLGQGDITCQWNGLWTNISFECKYVSLCEELKQCNSLYDDGEYWLYPTPLNGSKVSVYCDNMTSSPTPYITLHKTNMAVHEGGDEYLSTCNVIDTDTDAITIFHKIGINLLTMTVDQHDFKFTTRIVEASGTSLGYGIGGDCIFYTQACYKLGNFTIDTTGTGLIVNPELGWIAKGHETRVDNFIRSADNRAISATCGGKCGWCEPNGDLTLMADQSQDTSAIVAVLPEC